MPQLGVGKSRQHYLDFIRIIAVLLVIWAHLVNVASYDTTSWKLIFGDIQLPVFQKPLQIATLENALAFRGSSAGAVGVTLFFITSGYLMAGMSARYSRREFLINRGFRIFPTLWIFVIIVAIMQINLGLQIEFTQFLANMFLLTGIIPKAALIGITWTLILEMYFYLLTASVGRWTSKKVLVAGFLLFFIHEFVSKPGFYLVEFGFVSFDARRLMLNVSLFFLIMLIGTAMAVDKSKMSSITVLSLTLIALSDSRQVNKDWIGWDWNLTSIIVPILVFVIVQKISTQFPKFFSQKLFASLGDIVYPLYLFHISVGIGSILFFRNYFVNSAIQLLLALVMVFFSSRLIHVTVEAPAIKYGKSVVRKLTN